MGSNKATPFIWMARNEGHREKNDQNSTQHSWKYRLFQCRKLTKTRIQNKNIYDTLLNSPVLKQFFNLNSKYTNEIQKRTFSSKPKQPKSIEKNAQMAKSWPDAVF